MLGYLDPDYFLGGAMALDKPAAESAITTKVAEPLGTRTVAAAFGIHDLINETMAAAAKTHIAEKGGNPKIVTVSAFGGAGPVHAYGLARKIGAPRILVPPLAGVGRRWAFLPPRWPLISPAATASACERPISAISKPSLGLGKRRRRHSARCDAPTETAV